MRKDLPHDAVLLLSFGGPERPEDVMPFLENVTRGRGVPRERLVEVAKHYEHFGGVSPINAQNRALLAALREALRQEGPDLPVYWGNRNWHPLLPDALREMARDGVRSALAFATSAYASYSGCRQYLENIAAARAEVGVEAPRVDKLRLYYNHPGFIEAMVEHTQAALAALPPDRRAGAHLLFTAHSVPVAMARTSNYEIQLRETAELVVSRLPGPRPWALVYQSRSGPPTVPWLEPDIGAHLEALGSRGVADVVAVPIGFVSDHMEVKYDLDTEAAGRAEQLGLGWVRAATAGTHPAFVRMIRELILERVQGAPRRALGPAGPAPDQCEPGCCPSPGRPGGPPGAGARAAGATRPGPRPGRDAAPR